MDICGGIGKDNAIPWHSVEDLKHFQKITTTTDAKAPARNVVIMGRKTWESLPYRFRPLKDRVNIVVTSEEALVYTEFSKSEACISNKAIDSLNDFDYAVSSIREALDTAYVEANGGNVFIIGGSQIYGQAIREFKDELRHIYLTIFPASFNCDTYVPDIYNMIMTQDKNRFKSLSIDDELTAQTFINTYEKNVMNSTTMQAKEHMFIYTQENNEENEYLDLLRHVLIGGSKVLDRTGTGCLSVFPSPKILRFDMESGRFPALTTKRMYLRGGICEMLFFISGSTDVTKLQSMGVNYWNGNTNREFLDKRGLTEYREYDMGPTYSFMFKYQGIGHMYEGCDVDYREKGGFDQLSWVISEIKHNPSSRRLLINLWDPRNMHKMSLPPCAYSYQFHVNQTRNTLDCLLTQRSGDLFLGVPMNFISAAALLCMIAHVTGYKPGVLSHVIADAHIYCDHISQVQTQLSRVSRPFPRLSFRREIYDIHDFRYSDFCFDDYRPLPSIKAPMST